MVKTITIMEDAYETLKSMKQKDESFSDVIRRVGSETKVDLRKWLGVLKNKGQRAEEWNSFIKESRKKFSEDYERRLKKLGRQRNDSA